MLAKSSQTNRQNQMPQKSKAKTETELQAVIWLQQQFCITFAAIV